MRSQKLFAVLSFLLLLFPFLSLGEQLISNQRINSAAKKRILVLNAYHQGYSWTDRIMEGVFSVFNKHPNTELFVEYMDTKRKTDEKYFLQLSDLYKYKYQGMRLDAIVSSDDHALDFLLKFRDELFPETPVFFSGINDFKDSRISHKKWFTGVVEEYDVAGTLELILKLHPDASMIAVVNDHTKSGIASGERTKRVADGFKMRIKFKYLTNFSQIRLKKSLNELPEDAVVLYITYLRTPDGLSLSIEESTRMVVEASNLPVYCYWDYILGNGVVGGKVVSAFYQGKTAASMAQRYLNGERLENMPVVKDSPNIYMFDFHALNRFDIGENSLPAGSVLIDKPFSFYEEFKNTIWLVAGFIILLGFIIVFLVFNILQRRQIQKELTIAKENTEKSEERYRQLFDHANEAIFIAQDGKLVFLNPMTTKLIGYSNESLLRMQFTEFIHPDDREMVINLHMRRLKGEDLPDSYLFRIIWQDGNIRWVELNTVLIEWEGRAATLNYLNDTTERKQAEMQIKSALREKETLLHEIHHRVKNNMQVINSLMKLQANSIKDDHYKNLLIESQNRIYAMSAVHEILYNSKNLAEIQLLPYLKQLSSSVIQSYSMNTGKLQMIVEGDDVKVNIDKASPLGLTVNELISNALKYAFADDRKGKIEVTLQKQDDRLELTVKDNGVGLPEGFDWKNSNTLGLKLVRNLVESQLNGSIDVHAQEGTKFTITISLDA